MKVSAAVAMLLMLGNASLAAAQSPGSPGPKPATPAQKPTPPVKPVTTKPTTPSAPVAPTSGRMELLCRNVGFTAPGGAQPMQSGLLHYQHVNVRNAAGEVQRIYVPTQVMIQLSFRVSTTPVSGRGESLPVGSCGLATSVIELPATSSAPRLQIANPPAFSLSATDNRSSSDKFVGSGASLSLPACPSGVRRFTVNRTGSDFFVDLLSPDNTACVD
jgi:hypothetical protein